MGVHEVLVDIENLKNIIKRHMDALRALEAADVEMLEDLDDLEHIFKEEASLLEKKIKARDLNENYERVKELSEKETTKITKKEVNE